MISCWVEIIGVDNNIGNMRFFGLKGFMFTLINIHYLGLMVCYLEQQSREGDTTF